MSNGLKDSKPKLVVKKPAPDAPAGQARRGRPQGMVDEDTVPTERLEPRRAKRGAEPVQRHGAAKQTPPVPSSGQGAAARGPQPSPLPGYSVQTMGVSNDWQQATGSSSLDNRGEMTGQEMDNALKWMLLMPVPASPPPRYTLPTLVVQTNKGALGFVNNHGHLWCHEAGCHLEVTEAMDLIQGKTTTAQMHRMKQPTPQMHAQARAPAMAPGMSGPGIKSHPGKPSGVSTTGRVLGLVFGIPLTLFGGLVLWFGFVDDNLVGGVLGGALFIVPGLLLLFLLGFRSSRKALPYDPVYPHPSSYDTQHHASDALYHDPTDSVSNHGGGSYGAGDSGSFD